jgi:hypothetical protein
MQRNALGVVVSELSEVEPVEDLDFRNARTALLLASLPVLLVEGRPNIPAPTHRLVLESLPVRIPDTLMVRLRQNLPLPSRWGINE